MAIDPNIQILGTGTNGGCYLLAIRLNGGQNLQFGMFNQGQEICRNSGEYLYIGSARGKQGARSLGYRLLRHATRSGDARPLAIRNRLLHAIKDAGLPTKVPAQKTCCWHIDYLLDLSQAEITGVIAVCSRQTDEKRLAELLAAMPETDIPAPDPGASDHPGDTHLLLVRAASKWWKNLPQLLLKQILNHRHQPNLSSVIPPKTGVKQTYHNCARRVRVLGFRLCVNDKRGAMNRFWR